MSDASAILHAMGVEQWLPRQSPVVAPTINPLVRNILFYVNTHLMKQAQDVKKSLDNITQYVENIKISEIYSSPERKQRVLYDLRNLVV